MIANQLLCQMTTEWGTFGKDSTFRSYDKCGKPAKYENPEPKMGVKYVCGIHARSLDMMYSRMGSSVRCIPIRGHDNG